MEFDQPFYNKSNTRGGGGGGGMEAFGIDLCYVALTFCP